MMFGEIAVARRTVELPPGATAGMAVGTQVAQASPTAVVTARTRTEVLRGVNFAGAAVGRWHRFGRYRTRRFGMYGVSLTQGAVRLLRQPLKRFRLVGALTLGLEGRRGRW